MIIRIRRYGMLMTVMTIAIVIITWRYKAFMRKFHDMSLIAIRKKELEQISNDRANLNGNSEMKDRFKECNFESLEAIIQAGDMSGIAKDQKERMSRQRGFLHAREIAAILKQLISELIDLRVTLNGKYAEIIDEKYDKFQKILQSIEQSVGTFPTKGGAGGKMERKFDICREKRVIGKANNRFGRMNCTKSPLSEIASVIIDNPNLSTVIQNKLADEIRLHHKGIKVLTVFAEDIRGEGKTRAFQINRLVAEITTPLVFISRQLQSWTTHIDLERLADFIISKTDVVAVGSSVVNTSNSHWSHGCAQSRLKNYVLKYERGYYNSVQSCIKCDALEGPFLVKTHFLQKNRFNDFLNYGYYEDWFLYVKGLSWRYKAKKRGKPDEKVESTKNMGKPLGLIYSCPDVTSLVTIPEFNSSNMVKMADLWDIKKIVHSNGRAYWFGCKHAAPEQGRKCYVGRGMAVPPCCLDNLMTAIKFVMRKCHENYIACELIEGTLLGAVKFQSVLPWERDADIAFYAEHFDRLIIMAADFKKVGYGFKVRDKPWCCVGGRPSGGAVLITAHGWNIEMYGSHSLDSYESIKQGRAPTRINFAGEMVNVPDNPGRVMRNRYGEEIYKHAEHWMINRMNSGWDQYKPKYFNKCEAPGHHACLDQNEADGSLQFKDM